MAIVRIVRWPGGVPEGSIVTGRDLVVLADDTGHRVVFFGVFLNGGGRIELRNPQLEAQSADQD